MFLEQVTIIIIQPTIHLHAVHKPVVVAVAVAAAAVVVQLHQEGSSNIKNDFIINSSTLHGWSLPEYCLSSSFTGLKLFNFNKQFK